MTGQNGTVVVSFDNVSVELDGQRVLEDINFRVHQAAASMKTLAVSEEK